MDARSPHAAWEPQLCEIVAVRDAEGNWLRKVARSPFINGHDFPVCWVDWEGDEPSDGGMPWPIEDVHPIADHPDALTEAEFLVR